VLGPGPQIFLLLLQGGLKTTLQEAEGRSAAPEPSAHADLAAGQSILETWLRLGVRCRCGWRGKFPNSEVTAVSNSQAQREYIEWEAAVRGLKKSSRGRGGTRTCFEPERQFDRIVSVEMFEHIVNWAPIDDTGQIMARGRRPPSSCISIPIVRAPIGSIRADGEDWIAPHFLQRAGVMPSPSSDPAILGFIRG